MVMLVESSRTAEIAVHYMYRTCIDTVNASTNAIDARAEMNEWIPDERVDPARGGWCGYYTVVLAIASCCLVACWLACYPREYAQHSK